MSVEKRRPDEFSNELLTSLLSKLRARIAGEVRFDSATKAIYASDASNYRQIPIGAIIPRTIDDLQEALKVCCEFDVPFLPRGGGTSQNGQCVNVAVVADVSKFVNRVVEIDAANCTALVEPGVICDSLRTAAERYGLTFAPDPATHSRCTLGGMIANNSCGAHSVMAGKTSENVEELEVVTYDGCRFWVGPTSEERIDEIIRLGGRQGEIYRKLRDLRDKYGDEIRREFPAIKRRVSGFNLDQLLPENGFNIARALVGTEGTCAVTLQARVRLVKSPAVRVALVLGFPDIFLAADSVSHFNKFVPIAIEGLDRAIIRGLQARGLKVEEIALLPEGDAWVILEFGADTAEQALDVATLAATYFSSGSLGFEVTSVVVTELAQQARIWSIRETGASAVALTIDASKPDPIVGWEDAAVDPLRLGAYLREFQQLVDRFGYETCLYGHFGDGCVHARINFDIRTASGISHWRSFLRAASELVVAYGGSLSGEHGDGQAKAEFLPIMYSESVIRAMSEFKSIWDPRNKLNPGKVVNAYRVDENLRMGPQYKPVSLTTKLTFNSPEGNGFQRAVERCIGMGKCRSLSGGTMCPSYRATLEEKYSTRGRAHLFWEMLQGDVVKDGWNSAEVKDAVSNCLSCKGCKSDCPTHTDMASYKAEFLSHYYELNARPRQAFFMGRIADWAPFASRVPKVFNFAANAPLLGGLVKRVAGVAKQRHLPKFAPRSYRQSVRRDDPAMFRAGFSEEKRVILWVDTFNNYFTPSIVEAAVKVLRAFGYQVVLPAKRLCCGRPLYDFGLLDRAKSHLRATLEELKEEIIAGTKIVGLEPGCLSVFKDELLKQLPDDDLANRLSEQTLMLSDLLATENYNWKPLDATVLLHTHCHQKALFGSQGDKKLLDRLGVKWSEIDSGCCGMAGSFGFDENHADLSLKIGEEVLLPAVRASASSTLIVTNGFSCREQIEQATSRTTVHVIELALRSIESK